MDRMQLKIIKARDMKYERINRSPLTKVAYLLCKKKYKEGYVFWADYYMMINNILHRREHLQKESGG
ncbi:hypothetical protein ABGV43_12020 [Paenibacillus amylolyticus]